MGIEAHFPEFIEPAAGTDRAQSQNILRPGDAPKHARLFAARAEEGLAAGFNDPRTDEEASTAEGAILHTRYVAGEVTQFLFHCLSSVGASTFLARSGKEFFDLVPE